ncbi:MAG TPA: XdhC/CoxI family protein [Anaerolineales bacterium]|nr:XdhC/CoxI family protein [Anaerolineales bacterium]
MKDILGTLADWFAAGEAVALATVVSTWGSSPRAVGAKMGILADGRMAGSVSGGCVEGAVVGAGIEVLQTGRPRLLRFGVADETAWEVGLACGGEIDVFVQPLLERDFTTLRIAMSGGDLLAVLTAIEGDEVQIGNRWLWDGSPGSAPDAYLSPVREAHADRKSRRVVLSEEKVELFIEVLEPEPRLIIVGGVHISIALARIARVLGFRTVVVDPRRAFGSDERFGETAELVQSWPDEALDALAIDRSTAVAVLTHDPKLDDPALLVALRSEAFYVGALGSRKTQAQRRTRLMEAGLTEEQLDRLHGPIGLEIGARTPEEIALAVMGEIVANKMKK